MNRIKIKEKAHMQGKYIIVKTDAEARYELLSQTRMLPRCLVKFLDLLPTKAELEILLGGKIYQSPVIHNKIVSGTGGYGRNLVMRAFANDSTYPLPITLGAIGTGTNTPADSDTGLQTAVLSSISYTDRTVTNDSIELSFFITDATLANGTYTEWGIFCATRLFSRSLISPTYAKAAGQDTTIIHVVTLS